MRSVTTLKAAGKTDPGRQRTVNEDRVHVDASRGLFIVIDGVGGQAAGGKAADVALSMLRMRLERETGPPASRIREALTIANNEIHRLAGTRAEWNGMACVATVLAVEGSRAFVGHVGDTRLYKLSLAGIEKVTRDHSPVGEREDAGEISELEAMRHSRRNEVYRDLGSDPHEPEDPEFIDVREFPFEQDSALLMCSDGLTDLIESSTIDHVVRQLAGEPDRVVSALIDAANGAGGKDNVTVVYVEGDQFAATPARFSPPFPLPSRESYGSSSGQLPSAAVRRPAAALANEGASAKPASNAERYVRLALLVLLTMLLAVSLVRLPGSVPLDQNAIAPSASSSGQLVVRPGESISEALSRATAGMDVVVEPGEYREAVSLRSNVRLVSRVPAGAILRLPANASETDAAAVAIRVSGAALVGFRIVGDATTALGIGLLVRDAEVSVVDTRISGATNVAIDVGGTSSVDVMASDVHDNPGAAFAVRSGASARITHNVFMRNGGSPHTPTPMIIEESADFSLAANMFYDTTPSAFRTISDADRAAIVRDNWFSEPRATRSAVPVRSGGARGGQSGRPGQPRQR
jgi:serine/threonine protein phosphatase PrpC